MILYLFKQWPNHLGVKGVNYNKLYVCSVTPVLDLIQSLKAVLAYILPTGRKPELRNVKWFT